MALVRWDPFRELENMQNRLNRFFGDAPSQRTGEDVLSFSGWSPAVDVQETDKEYVIKADLPDVKKEDVKVEHVQAEFKNGVLNVHLPKSATPKPKAIEVKVS